MTQNKIMDIRKIPQNEFDRIADVIRLANSPVGIDALKTHVIIIKKLEEIEKRLERLENRG